MTSFVQAIPNPTRRSGEIKLHGPQAFEGMRRAGRLAAEALDLLTDIVKPGVTTDAIDTFALDFAIANKAYPATLLYRGYRYSVCTSVNHVVCHGMPSGKPLREGDIVNIDLTYILDGWHGDSSRMYPVGDIGRRAERLLSVTHEALMRGIAAARPGGTTGDIGQAIQDYAEGERCSVVRDFCGHGLGRLFHDEPNILHYGRRGEGIPLKPGMFFTIEPMINLGRPQVKVLSDGWTAVTRDRSLSAQYEHSVGVTETGVEIFTLSPREPPPPIRVPTHERRQGMNAGVPPGMSEAPHYLGHRERLRERFAKAGADALADYELLELILFRAAPRRDVKPLAKALLQRFGSLAEVVSAPIGPLTEIKGMGEAAALEMKVVEAVAKRFAKGAIAARPVLGSWSALLDYCRTAMAFSDKESFRILFLDKRNGLIADEVQQTGTVDHTPVYPREIVKRALELSATAVILVHNHPSGDPHPSSADIRMTTEIVGIAAPLGIKVHDHLIVGRDGHASFRGLKLLA